MSDKVAKGNRWTILNYIGKVKVTEGDMGRGAVLVVEDKRLGDWPICSINAPMKDQRFNMAVADFIAEIMNGNKK